MVHYKPFVRSQATKLAGSFEELVTLTRRYLENPDLEREQRSNLAETMCYKVDGKSAERISSYLLDVLDRKTAQQSVVMKGQ